MFVNEQYQILSIIDVFLWVVVWSVGVGTAEQAHAISRSARHDMCRLSHPHSRHDDFANVVVKAVEMVV